MAEVMFAEFSKRKPNFAKIRRLLNRGQADINATQVVDDVRHFTVLYFIQQVMFSQKYMGTLMNGLWRAPDYDEKLGVFKAYFYPILDILEDYEFDIMSGVQYILDAATGEKVHRVQAGLNLLRWGHFEVLAENDLSRLIKFFEKLYFSKGYTADDTSVTAVPMLRPLMNIIDVLYQPGLIMYLIIKGADWRPYAANVRRFGAKVSAEEAAELITTIQNALGGNFIVGPAGHSLRGFLAAAYGGVKAIAILNAAVKGAATERRMGALPAAPAGAAAGAGGQGQPGYIEGGTRRRRMTRRRK